MKLVYKAVDTAGKLGKVRLNALGGWVASVLDGPAVIDW
jgi:hypothetical protein